MLPHAEKLISRAKRGDRLTVVERRHCVMYLTSTRPDLTNTALGDMFGVSEGMIRQDITKLKKELADRIKQDDIGLVIADIALNFDRQMKDLEKGKAASKPGQRTHLEYCKAIFQLELQRVKAMQDLGYYPKNLGNMTVEKFEYAAIVTQDGTVDTREVDMQFVDDDDVIDVTPEPLQLPAAKPEAAAVTTP